MLPCLARPLPGVAALLLAALATSSFAQGLLPGEVSTALSISGINQFTTDLDQGGEFDWRGVQFGGNVTRQFTPAFAAGISLRYDRQDWHWEQPAGFGGIAKPWSTLNNPLIGINLSYVPAPGWRLGFNPVVEWNGESGADSSESLSYGAVLSATRTFSPELVLGLGIGVFRQIDEDKVFPILLVNWKISDRLRLVNPLPAGPAGGAGLELTYAFAEGWEIGGGGSYRSYRFRLKDDGPVPDGIGENRFSPAFARISYSFDAATRADLYLAALLNGKLSLSSANDRSLHSDQYETAPTLGLTLSHRF